MEYSNRFQLDPDNKPMARAGIYRITHIASGKCYIGMSRNVAHRCRGHAQPHKRAGKLKKALDEFGPAAFLFEPVAYALNDDLEALFALEEAEIARHNSVRDGLNVAERSRGPGGYGEAFRRRLKAAKNTPEARATHLRLAQCPIERAKRGAAIQAAMADPEVRARMSASAKRAQGTAKARAAMRERYQSPEYRMARLANEQRPEVKANRSRAMLVVQNDPAVQEKRRQSLYKTLSDPTKRAAMTERRSGTVWITDGATTRWQKAEKPIPEGWRRGRK